MTESLYLELYDLDEEEALQCLAALEAELPTCQWCKKTGLCAGKLGHAMIRLCDDHRVAGAFDLPFAKLVRALVLWRRIIKSERPTLPDADEARRRSH